MYRSSSEGRQPSQEGSTLYKTELCRTFTETGTCRYAAKCQFAHGATELRPVTRHRLYKTEVCKNFTRDGVCPYGPRCRFIHAKAPVEEQVEEEEESPPPGFTATPFPEFNMVAAIPRRLPIFQRFT